MTSEGSVPLIWMDFNDRLVDGTCPTLAHRSTVRTGDRIHAYDHEGNCALMDVLTVSDLPKGEDYDTILLHMDMLEWHRPACKEVLEKIASKSP